MKVRAVALKERMRRDRQEDVEIARRASARAGFAFACETNARTILDARRDIDGQCTVARDPTRPGTGRARIVDHLPAALTAGTGPFKREESLRMADTTRTTTMRTRLWLAASLGAGAGAGFTSNRSRDPHLRGLAVVGLIEPD